MKTAVDPAKLKVVELRAELSARGLDTRGNKAVLIDRLRDALSQEMGDSPEAPGDSEGGGKEMTREEDMREDESAAPSETQESVHESDADQAEDPQIPHISPKKEPGHEEENQSKHEVEEEEEQQKTDGQSVDNNQNEEEHPEHESAENETVVHVKEEPMEEEPTKQSEADTVPDVKVEKEVQEASAEQLDVKKEPEPAPPEVKHERRSATRWSTVKEETNDKPLEQARGQKRQRSPSPELRNQSFREPVPRKPDDEPDFDPNSVILDWYDSDLNLVISKEKGFTAATPMHDEGFAYVWAGARASHGITGGKVYFEVRVSENCDISHLAEQEPNPNVLRVGWSTMENSMQLGEEPLSFGYGGTGKASTNCAFKDYGKPFDLGDVVTSYLDMDSNPARISYSVNGQWQGFAYEVPKEKLDGKALFPHILSKNCSFECFFGSGPAIKQEDAKPDENKPQPWVGADADRADFVPIGQLAPPLRVPGPKRPEKRSDCEAIMMVGLPGCGKTTWAIEWAKKHPGKLFNILGTNSLIDKMKLMGLPRKRNYHGRWDVLIEKCTKCLNRLLALAGSRRRNYIIDQTNVYPSAQRRKMKGFEGFVRRAVVIVPTDEEFKKRRAKQEKVEGKDVPESSVLEMKANFKIPEVGESFDEIIFEELGEQQSKEMVAQYNKEAREAGYVPQGPPQKRFRGGGSSGGPMRGGNRDHRGGRDHIRGGPHAMGSPIGGRGGRGDFRGRGGNWTPRGNNWRDNRQPYQAGGGASGGGFRNRGGGGGGGGWRGNWVGGGGGNYRGGSSYDRNRSGGTGGGRGQPAGGKGGWGGNWSGGNNSGGNWGGSGYGHGWGGQQGWKGYNQPSESGYGSQSSYSQDSYGSSGHYGSSDSVYSADGQGNFSQGGYDATANQQGGYGTQGGQTAGYAPAGGYGSATPAGATGSYSGAESGYGGGANDWNQQYYQGYGNGSQSWNQGYPYGSQATSGGSGYWQGSGTGSYGVAGAAAAGATTAGYDYGAQGAAVGSGTTGNVGYGK